MRLWVALFTTAANNRPTVMANWYEPTMKPRIHFGAVSDWYRGTDEGRLLVSTRTAYTTRDAKIDADRDRRYSLNAEIKPTPKPAKNRPARKRGMAVAAAWKATPRVKTPVEAINPHLRPMKSPMGAAPRAPKKVPADKIDTMAEDWLEVIVRLPSASV